MLKGSYTGRKSKWKTQLCFLKEVNDLGISGDLFCEVNNMMRGIHEYKQSTRQREPWLFHKERGGKGERKNQCFFFISMKGQTTFFWLFLLKVI